jgi:hypothetical protein
MQSIAYHFTDGYHGSYFIKRFNNNYKLQLQSEETFKSLGRSVYANWYVVLVVLLPKLSLLQSSESYFSEKNMM